MYEELYERIPDPEAYKERIGLGGAELKADKESLDRIIYSHLTHVAFENLDTWGRGVAPELGIKKLYEKIVLRRRGAWCFELNSLMNAFLKELGFETYLVVSHVMGVRKEIHPPAHCSIVVTIDGEKYFCDVGFGGPVPFGAMPFSGESRFGFHIAHEGMYTKLCNEVAGYVALQFKDIPADSVELVPLNYYISQTPESIFRNEFHVNIRYPDGSAAISENQFKLRRGDERIERDLVMEEIPAVLKEYFYIDPESVHFRNLGPNPN